MVTITEGDVTIALVSRMVHIQEMLGAACMMVKDLLQHLSDRVNFDIITQSMLIERLSLLIISSKSINTGIKNI